VEGIVKLFLDKEELALPMFSLYGMTRSNENLFSEKKKMWNTTYVIALQTKVI